VRLKLTDLIKLSGVTLNNWKLHCATGIKVPPLEAFFSGTFDHWQAEQNHKNFECDQVLALIHLGGPEWLFAGVYNVLGAKKGTTHNPDGFTYITEEVTGLEHLVGHAIVTFQKDFRASYLIGPKYEDKLKVAAIRHQRMTIGDFPGYKSTLLSMAKLRTVVNESHPSWHSALSSVGGVYLLTDNTTGMMYVGSAYGDEGIWSRWSNYANNGHGGNVELKQLLSENGAEHAERFQFSILEICDIDSAKEAVIARENYWKTVLRTREFGLNSN
jgi:hypothetical protein